LFPAIAAKMEPATRGLALRDMRRDRTFTPPLSLNFSYQSIEAVGILQQNKRRQCQSKRILSRSEIF